MDFLEEELGADGLASLLAGDAPPSGRSADVARTSLKIARAAKAGRDL